MKSLADAKSIELFLLLLILLVPGIIIDFVRGQFVGRRTRSVSEASLNYIVVSLIYYSIALPVALWVTGGIDRLINATWAWYPLWIIGPVIAGIALGWAGHRNVVWDSARRFGLNIVHPMPTAWDRRFSDLRGSWVVITLKDGRKVGGWMGQKSVASSDPENRDLYVEKIYEIDDAGFKDVGDKSALFLPGEISTVEFIKFEEKEANGRQDAG